MDHEVVLDLVGQPVEEVHRLRQHVGSFRQTSGAAVVVHEHTQGIDQFRQVLLGSSLLGNHAGERNCFVMTIDGDQAESLTQLEMEAGLFVLGLPGGCGEQICGAGEVADPAGLDGLLFEGGRRGADDSLQLRVIQTAGVAHGRIPWRAQYDAKP